jgi:hypothetical protein
VLGTSETTATVHAALREVVNRAARLRLVVRDFAGLTPATLERIRRPRTFDYPDRFSFPFRLA